MLKRCCNIIIPKSWLLFMACFACYTLAMSQELPVIKIDELEPMMNKKNDTVYVINFWATWCKPCIEELPDFETLNNNYKDRAVKVILVSLDFKKMRERVVSFLQKREMNTFAVLLDETDYDSWINKVEPDWSGAIPATLIYKNEQRAFYPTKLSYEELEKAISPHLNE